MRNQEGETRKILTGEPNKDTKQGYRYRKNKKIDIDGRR